MVTQTVYVEWSRREGSSGGVIDTQTVGCLHATRKPTPDSSYPSILHENYSITYPLRRCGVSRSLVFLSCPPKTNIGLSG